jgi:hypothetical protein
LAWKRWKPATRGSVGWHDLTLSGPIVISEPAGAMAGFVNDMWQRPVTDLGIPGKFEGKGGKQLIVGPGQDVPDNVSEYNVVRSKSNYAFYLTRVLETDPAASERPFCPRKGLPAYPYSASTLHCLLSIPGLHWQGLFPSVHFTFVSAFGQGYFAFRQ